MRNRADPPPSYYEPPDPEPLPVCPVCGEETDTFFKDYDGAIVGCDNCIKPVDAWEYREDHEETM